MTSMQPNLLALGKKVREARQRMSMTQQHLAERVDCSPEWISKIERGRASPSLSCISSIGHVLGADLTVLLQPAAADEGKEGFPEKAASLVRALNASHKSLAIDLIEALLRRQRDQESRD